MAIEHSMDRAFGRQWDVGEAAQQPLADFASTPAGMFVLHIQNVILHLKGKLVSVAIGTPASVGQPLHPAFLITIEDLVAGLARNAELPAQIRHRLASQSPSHELNSFIHDRTLLPRHPLSSPTKRGKCNLCVRYDLLPMCRVVHSCLRGLESIWNHFLVRVLLLSIPPDAFHPSPRRRKCLASFGYRRDA